VTLTTDSKIYVAGHRGLVGSAVVRALEAQGYRNLLVRTHQELDLTEQAAVRDFFNAERPDAVLMAAARVGGIQANNTRPAEFIRDNLLIQDNVIDAAYRAGVGKFVFLGSSCIYPKLAPQPIKEDYLLTGALEPTNEWYAIAKIAGVKMCQAYRREYGFNAISLMPTNLYDASTRPRRAAMQCSRSGERAHRAANSCTSTIWPTQSCTCCRPTMANPS
jgi:GDP-L-fucose synthase